MSKNRKNLIQRVAMTLLALVLTSASVWAAGDIYVGYLDPTAPIGMQRKTVLNPVWVDDKTVEIGTDEKTTWYFVSGTITKNTRIEVKGTVNLILADGCNFTASQGIHVPDGSALNIYAQSVANSGSIKATGLGNDAAIGGNGGMDEDMRDGTSGESSGAITIYGGNITLYGNMGGGDGGYGGDREEITSETDDEGNEINSTYDRFPGYGGNGGDGYVTIYSGYVNVSGNIGGGKAGTGQDENGGYDESYNGYNGGGTVKLSWANTSDGILADYYYGSVTLLKAFYGFDAGVVNDNDLLIWKNLMYAGDSYTVTIGSMPYGVTATADLILDAGFKKAVVGQVVTIGFSGVPDGKVPVVSVTYGAYNYEVFDIFDNGDGTFSFVMPDKSATVTVSELKNDIKSCTATVPDLSLGSNTSINYKFWDTPATIGETVTDDETTLTLGTDYQFGRITYADLTNHSEFDMPDHVGDECLVEIKGIGNYGGSKYVRFDIVNPSGNGTWGDLSWALSNGELTISGTGDMVKPQNDGTYPWLTYKSYIKTITIEEDVTSVADGAFSTAWNDYHYEVSTVSLPSTLTSIGEDAFAYCTGATITIPTGVTSIGNGAFLEVSNVVGSLDDNADNATLISLMHEAKRADVTISGRTLKKDGSWNTLCLPFDVDDFSGTPLADATVLELDVVGYYDDNNERYIKENDKYFKGQTEYTGVTSGFHQTGIDGNTLHIYFNPVARIKAGEPYLVKWEVTGENVENPEFTDVKVCDYATADKATTSKDGKVKFVGSYNPYASTGSAFLKESADASAQNAFRAFVKVNSVETIYSVQACNEPATILQTGNSMVYYVKNTLVLTETAGVEGLITHAVATDQLVSFTRSGLTANAYSTMCLPFSFKAPSACTFYAFKGIGWNSSNQQWEATISQQDANATLSAHTPYIFKCAETEATFTGTIATLPASYGDTDLNTGAVDASDGDDRNWKFKGTYTALDWTSAAPTEPTYGFSTYVPYNDGNTAGIAAGTFVRFIKGASLAPFRARLIYSGTNSHLNKASIRGTSDNADLPRYIVVRIVSDNGTITTVGAVDTETGEITNDVWFTLEGKMLTGEPTESGIYIYKGQKVSISK